MAKKKTQKVNTPTSPNYLDTSSSVRKVVTTEKETSIEATNPVSATLVSGQALKGAGLPFGKMNYILLGIGVALIAIGFFLMSLDGFVDATQFSISLHIAPLLVVGGFGEIIYAIMYQPRTPDQVQV